MEEEADKGGTGAAVGLERPPDMPLDDVLHAPAFLVVVPDHQLAGLRRGGEERDLDGHKGTQENHCEPHVSWTIEAREALAWLSLASCCLVR